MKVAKVDTSRLWMSNADAMRYLGVGADWLKTRRRNGILHYSKVGKTIFYIKAELDSLVRKGAVSGKQAFMNTK